MRQKVIYYLQLVYFEVEGRAPLKVYIKKVFPPNVNRKQWMANFRKGIEMYHASHHATNHKPFLRLRKNNWQPSEGVNIFEIPYTGVFSLEDILEFARKKLKQK